MDKLEELSITIISKLEEVQLMLDDVEIQANFDRRCISLTKTKIEEAQLWFANSRK